MKELVVISGKGGTGKTSLVGCFAALAKQKVLADCDVDAADLHLLLLPEIKERHEFHAGKRAIIRREDCIGCAACVAWCRFEAVRMDGVGAGEAVFRIDPFSCEGCGVCVHFCPQQAIDFMERKAGEWYISETRYGPMVHAQLGIAEGNSGKLVTLVRSQAHRIAKERRLDWVIIDGSPGIGCPVIASIAGADLILIVTEPSLSAQHDMERVVQLARHFRAPVALCINRYDLNEQISDGIHRWCKGKGILILGEIPYDTRFTEAQTRHVSLVEYSGGKAAQAIKSIWQGLLDAISKF